MTTKQNELLKEIKMLKRAIRNIGHTPETEKIIQAHNLLVEMCVEQFEELRKVESR